MEAARVPELFRSVGGGVRVPPNTPVKTGTGGAGAGAGAGDGNGDGAEDGDGDEAAAKLSVTNEWLYRRGKRLGLAVKLGDGTLRFSSVALDTYIKSQTISAAPARRKRAA